MLLCDMSRPFCFRNAGMLSKITKYKQTNKQKTPSLKNLSDFIGLSIHFKSLLYTLLYTLRKAKELHYRLEGLC